MKKVVGLFITVIIMFCQALTAASENVIQYNPIMLECSFITTGDPRFGRKTKEEVSR